MRRAFTLGVTVVVSTLLWSPAAAGKRIALPPVPVRVAQADAVVVGTVTEIEDRPVKAPLGPGSNEEAEWTVAVVKVDKAVLGLKGLTHIKVGQTPSLGRAANLSKGQEVCLFLGKHTSGNFYVPQGFQPSLDPKGPNFKAELAEAEKAAAVIAKPAEALKAKDDKDRQFAATLLVLHHRYAGDGDRKTKALGADESKAILEALAGADWKTFAGDFHLHPRYAFSMLGLTEKDAWNPGSGEFDGAAQAWLKKNAGTYRIQRYQRGDDN